MMVVFKCGVCRIRVVPRKVFAFRPLWDGGHFYFAENREQLAKTNFMDAQHMFLHFTMKTDVLQTIKITERNQFYERKT